MSTINLEYSEGGKYIPSALQALHPIHTYLPLYRHFTLYIPSALQALNPIHTFPSTGTSPYTYLPLFRHFTLYIPSALQALRPIQPSALQVLCPIQPSVSALQIPTFRYRHFAQYNFPYSTVPILEIHTFGATGISTNATLFQHWKGIYTRT